jgi:AraC family transcriptional regulator of arabinose operon
MPCYHINNELAKEYNILNFSGVKNTMNDMTPKLSFPDIHVSDYYNQGPEYHVVRDAGSGDWLILFTTNGSGAYKAGNETRYCGKGDIVIIPAGIPHDYKTAESAWAFHWAHFIPSEDWFAKLKLPPLLEGIHSVRILDQEQPMEQAFRMIHQNQHDSGKYRRAFALNLMEFIFILIAQEYDNQQSENVMDPRIISAMQYLSSRLNQSLNLNDIANHVSLSPSRLSHLFKQETGKSIMDTFMKMRLRHASSLLQYTSQTVEQIALHTGFSSVYYFSTAFKKYAGMSPTAFRTNKIT